MGTPDHLAERGILQRSVLWGALGFVCFAIAGYLTWTIAHVTNALSATAPDRLERNPEGWYIFGVVGHAEESAHAVLLFDYTREDSEAVLTFELPPGAQRLVARDLVQGYACRRVGPDTDAMGVELPWESLGADFAFDVTAAARDTASHINCNSLPRFLPNSFTTIASTFYNRGGPDDLPAGQKYLPVQVVVNGRDGPVDVAATANATAGDSPIVQPGGIATFRFHSMRAEEARDWHILMIGVLIGFGAAMVIEAIRPLIERIGTRPPVDPPQEEAGGAA